MVVIVLSFEQGHSIGLPDRVFSFNNIQIFADGKMSSDFEDEFNPSLSLNLSDALILKAGSTITVWIISVKLEFFSIDCLDILLIKINIPLFTFIGPLVECDRR